MNLLDKKNISKFIIILPISGILMTIFLFVSITIYSINNNFEIEKKRITKQYFRDLKHKTKKRVTLAYNLIDTIYKNSQNKKQAISLIQKILKNLKWTQNGYIFVFDYKGNSIYHPNPNYMGTNGWNFERNGVKVVQLLIKSALSNPNGTYVTYLAYNPKGKPQEKISFVKIYKPLHLVIGSGIYLNYLDTQLIQQKNYLNNLLENILSKIFISSALILLFMLIITCILSYKLKTFFEQYDKTITEEKEKLFIRANFDILTKLYNREYFFNELQKQISLIKRNHYKLAVLFIDLDHFKDINDTLGHNIGDKVLKITAKRLKSSVRESDIIARFGGDEFIILLTNIDDINKIVELTNRILNKVKEVLILKNHQYYISASIGISIAPDDTTDAQTLIQYADIAMYKSKHSGKDKFTFYKSEMTDDAHKRIDLKNDIFKALHNNEFELYYQPQFDVDDKIIGVEVLIRWHHPKKGLLYPMEFLPLAIELDLIDKIDLWVIENSIIQFQKWKEKNIHIKTISCNITMNHLLKDNFINDLEKIMKKHYFDPKYLDLEIREKCIMKYPKKTLKVLEKLSKLGVQISIDDFGKGYLSLLYLKKFNISKLKIDKTFIKDITKNKDDEIITKAMINLAKNLNLEIVAEGVETQKQKEILLQYAKLYMQGFLYSKPLPKDQFENLILKGKK